MSMDDAEEIVRRSEEKHVKVSACHQNRFNVAVQQMRKALEAGRFGKISTAPSMCAGTGTTAIMTRPLAGHLGLRMAAAS